MRKLKKISLKELEKEAICLDESELRLYMGGYDPNDCWWRCIAYINSCGSNYSADDAMEMAREIMGIVAVLLMKISMALQVAVAIIANVLITFSAQALIVAVVAGRFLYSTLI